MVSLANSSSPATIDRLYYRDLLVMRRNAARSKSQLVATPKTSAQNGVLILKILTPDDVTRKAVNAPKSIHAGLVAMIE
jgi:hypothetical protein